MGRNRRDAGKATAIGIALVSLVGISATRCGGDDDVTEANIGPKLAAALCGAEANCCASQGFTQSADARLICEGNAGITVSKPNGYVFNHDVAVACVKAAQAYPCRDISIIDQLCRRTWTDPARPPNTPPLAAEGATCALLDTPYTCAFYDGLTCVRDAATSSTGTCRKVSMSGGSCESPLDCVPNHYCDPTAMTCVPRLADGVACDPSNFQCESNMCTNGVCAARVACTLS